MQRLGVGLHREEDRIEGTEPIGPGHVHSVASEPEGWGIVAPGQAGVGFRPDGALPRLPPGRLPDWWLPLPGGSTSGGSTSDGSTTGGSVTLEGDQQALDAARSHATLDLD